MLKTKNMASFPLTNPVVIYTLALFCMGFPLSSGNGVGLSDQQKNLTTADGDNITQNASNSRRDDFTHFQESVDNSSSGNVANVNIEPSTLLSNDTGDENKLLSGTEHDEHVFITQQNRLEGTTATMQLFEGTITDLTDSKNIHDDSILFPSESDTTMTTPSTSILFEFTKDLSTFPAQSSVDDRLPNEDDAISMPVTYKPTKATGYYSASSLSWLSDEFPIHTSTYPPTQSPIHSSDNPPTQSQIHSSDNPPNNSHIHSPDNQTTDIPTTPLLHELKEEYATVQPEIVVIFYPCDSLDQLVDFGDDVDNMIRKETMTGLPDSIRTDACSKLMKTKCFQCADTAGHQCDSHVTCCYNNSTISQGVADNNTLIMHANTSMVINQNEEFEAKLIDEDMSKINRSKSDIGVVCRCFSKWKFLMIRGCPIGYSENTTRKLCEEDIPVREITLDTTTVVTDDLSGLTFFNRYCAECNGVLEMSKWDLEVRCDEYIHVLKALNYTEFVRLALTKNSTCVLDQSPKEGGRATACDDMFFMEDSKVISSCDVDGGEVISNRRIEEECLGRPMDLTHRVVSGNLVFKNVFCLLCNRQNMRGMSCNGRNTELEYNDISRRPAFSFLFGFHENRPTKRPSSYDVTTCDADEWKDPQGTCRKLVCTEGKVFQDGQCVTALDEIKGLPYKVLFWLLPAEPPCQPVNYNSLKYHGTALLEEIMDKKFYGMVKSIKEITLGIVCRGFNDSQSAHGARGGGNSVELFDDDDDDDDDDEAKIHKSSSSDKDNDQQQCDSPVAWIEVYIESDRSSSRDEFESAILNMLNSSCCQSSNLFKRQLLYGNFPAPEMKKKCEESGNAFPCFLFIMSTNSHWSKKEWNSRKLNFLSWRPFLVCPYIRLPKNHVKVTALKEDPFSEESFSLSIKVIFNDSITIFSDHFEMSQISENPDDNKTFVYICQDVLASILPRVEIKAEDEYSIHYFIQYVLTTVCVSVSVICLFVTVTTYCLFSSLRCVAGCNTLGLSSSLMVAQMVTQVGANLDYDKVPSPLCVGIGVAIHYAWLSVLAWSFLCCLHMLRVFTTNVRSAHRSKKTERRGKIRNVVLSLFIPVVITGTTVVTSYVVHDGKRIGYGYWQCLYDNSWAIYAPLIATTLCNAAFFSVVIFKIWKVRRLQANMDFRKEEKKDFIVYMKLSTFTGVFWLLSMLAEIFQSDVLRYIAIVVNGSQGIFIFCSFTWNPRVFDLYGHRFGCLSFLERKKSTTTTTTASRYTDSSSVSAKTTTTAHSSSGSTQHI